MKKLLLLATVAASISGLSAFGQGYFALGGPARGAWDVFSSGTAKFGNNISIGILWGSSSSTPLISSIMNATPTNAPSVYDPTAAWNAILTDPNFHFAVDNNTAARIQPTTGNNSSWVYTTTGGFSSVPVTGTAAGTTYHLYVIGWDKNYADPTAAAAANAALGWSAVFNYTAVDSIGTPTSLASNGFVPFGVTVVPEPTTFALAGLGAAALMVFRRRK